MKKLRIGVIFGGKSGEYEVSLMSAMLVLSAIDEQKYDIVKIGITKQGRWLLYDGPSEHIREGTWQAVAEQALAESPEQYNLVVMASDRSLKDIIDFAFPVLHGPNGEDGTIQGLFEMLDIPYAGSGVTGSAAAMDKVIAKELFTKAGIPTCPYRLVLREAFDENPEKTLDMAENQLKYPIFVKPANMGSSVGITKAKNREELAKGIRGACMHDRRIVLEEGLNARELETGVLGNYSLRVVAVGEVVAAKEFYDYEAKYCDDFGAEICVPAKITEAEKKEIQQIALKAYKALDCRGFARVDCFMEKQTGKILINEVNTIPGFTKYSMLPMLCKEEGIGYAQLVEMIIDLGFAHHKAR